MNGNGLPVKGNGLNMMPATYSSASTIWLACLLAASWNQPGFGSHLEHASNIYTPQRKDRFIMQELNINISSISQGLFWHQETSSGILTNSQPRQFNKFTTHLAS
jgi:hypothetical protein